MHNPRVFVAPRSQIPHVFIQEISVTDLLCARHQMHPPLFFSQLLVKMETALVDQWLRLSASKAGVTGLIPGQGTKIPRATKVAKK